MRETITSTIVKCDACKHIDPNCAEHRIDNLTIDLCPKCERVLHALIFGDDFEVSLNMNHSISVCLGEDSADSYNKYWAGYKALLVKPGEWRDMQFWNFLQQCADAFRKSTGSLQKIATPFEIRMKFSDLNIVENQTNE